jgi:hypothetical protein
MHDPQCVHLLQAAQQAEHKLFHFLSCEETIGLLNFVEKLSTSEELEDNIDGVV